MMDHDWTVVLKHVYRECNNVADSLAKFDFRILVGMHELNEPPDGVKLLISKEARDDTQR